MGNEVLNLRKDLIDLDMEELKINRELYNLQTQINAKLPDNKKVRIKNKYKQYVERKLKALEEKKRILLENQNNINNNNKQSNNDKKELSYNVIETGIAKNEEIKIDNTKNNKLSLISKNSKESNKENNNNDNKKKNDMISNSESDSKIKVKTIYTKKKSNKYNDNEEDMKNDIEEEDKKDNDNNNTNNNKNNRYQGNNIKNDDLEENLNINEYKRKFFEKLSSLGPRSNINKSMDNKNSSIVEELEVVGLSQNDILKDKLSDFFVGTSVATSSKHNQNNSSLHNHYYKNKAKSEISGVNGQQLISSSKSYNEDGNNKGLNSINCQNYDRGEYGRDNEKIGTGRTGEKYETEESINNKETGSNTNEKYKDNSNENENINEKKMLKNNRNKSYFVLQDVSSIVENSQIKESEN